MRGTQVLPVLYLICALISLTILQSIASHLVISQAVFFLLGAIIFTLVSRTHTRWWQYLIPLSYFFTVCALATTLAFGALTRGSTRWITIGGINIQPSQVALPVTIATASIVLARRPLEKSSDILLLLMIISLPIGLIFIEPDLDTTIVLTATIGIMILHSGISLRTVLLGTIGAIVLIAIGWNVLLQPYQKQRVFSFLASADLNSAGYNARQSMIAVGSGQWTGRGLGHGVQSQLRFLPERQTDFIFASIAEETGIVGASVVLLTYAAMVGKGIRVLLLTSESVHFFVMLGCTTLLTLQVGVNVGMNMGILPIAGLTLPLISYGGSSLLGFAMVCGMMQRVVIEAEHTAIRDIR